MPIEVAGEPQRLAVKSSESLTHSFFFLSASTRCFKCECCVLGGTRRQHKTQSQHMYSCCVKKCTVSLLHCACLPQKQLFPPFKAMQERGVLPGLWCDDAGSIKWWFSVCWLFQTVTSCHVESFHPSAINLYYFRRRCGDVGAVIWPADQRGTLMLVQRHHIHTRVTWRIPKMVHQCECRCFLLFL